MGGGGGGGGKRNYNNGEFSIDLFICSMSRRTAIVLQNYLLAERRVTPVCTFDQKTK